MLMMRTATSFLCLLLTLVAGHPDCDWTTCTGATDFTFDNFVGKWYVKNYQDVASGTPRSIVVQLKATGNRMTVTEKVVSSSDNSKCVEKVFNCVNSGSSTTCTSSNNEEITVTVLAHINKQEVIVRVMKGTELEAVYLKKSSSSGSVNLGTLKQRLNGCGGCPESAFSAVEVKRDPSCDF